VPTALSFLPYDDCNALTRRLVPEVRAAAGGRPVIAGLGAHDPRLDLDHAVHELMQLGATGVMNEPFAGIYGPQVQQALEDSGLGFSRELAMLAAGARCGLDTLGWAFTADEAAALAEMGVTYIGAMAGFMSSSRSDDEAFEEARELLEGMARAAKACRPEIPVLGHGGPLNSSAAIHRMVESTSLDGVVTGSNGETLPAVSGISGSIAELTGRDASEGATT
jgi:predicted TIM-barrel enzyme